MRRRGNRAGRDHADRARRALDLAVGGGRRERIGFIEAFDASEFPVRIAGEVKASTPPRSRRRKKPRRMDRNVLLALGAAQEAWREGGLNGFDPARVGIVVGSAIGGLPGIVEQQNVLRDRGPDRVSPFFIPSVLVDSASGQIAISLGLRGPNYAPVSACATGSHAVGEGAELIRRGDADAVLAGRDRRASIR